MIVKEKIYKNSFSYEEILHAYMQCRKNKRNSKSAVEFEKNFTSKLKVLLKEVNENRFKSGRYKVFPVLKPRLREIWAAPFKDRIIHHLIHNELQETFEKHFIDQTYSCLRGRGTGKCINDAFKGFRKITKNFQEDAFFIKLDIKSFFVSIDKEILWNIIKERLDENCLLANLTKSVIFDDITKNPIYVNKNLLSKIPLHKTLFNVDYKKQGLPIGNLTSQFFSNIYLDALDQYCKHVLKLKYYYRYADDILILIKDSKMINDIISKINEWLKQNRNLTLNLNKTIANRVSLGIKFLGSRLYKYYKIPSKILFNKIKLSSKKFKRNIFDQNLFASVNSYLGLNSLFNIYSFCSEVLNNNRLDLIYDNETTKIVYL